MTIQKCHVPGQVAFLTRRCTQRQFLLLNGRDGAVKNAMAFLFGLIAIRTHQVIHGVCFMANHYHSVQTDRQALRHRFMQDVHNFATKIINRMRNRRESIWSSGDPSDILLVDTNAIIEKLLYTWLNPVAAGLVDRVEDYDHFMILPRHWGKTFTIPRPDFFTGASGTPPFIRFTPMPPPGFEHMPLKEVIELFEGWIREREDEILDARKRPALGMERIYNTSPFETPKTSEPMYQRNPRFSGSCKEKLSKVISWWKHFRLKYRAALNQFKATGEAIFPPGTLKMVQSFGCAAESPLPSHPNYPRYARYG